MKKKALAGIIALGVVLIPILSYTFAASTNPTGLGDSSFRTMAEIQADGTVSFDDEAIALSDASSSNAGLRAQAISAYNLVNEERAAAGVPSLEWNQNLESASAVRAEECSQSFSHQRPNGKAWNTVNSAIQGGENLAFGFDTAEDAMQGWMNSPTHRDNILYDEFETIAISIYESDDGTLYWAQEYGY